MAEAAKTDNGAPTDEQYLGMVFEDGGDLVVNLTDVQELKFEQIPKGKYLASVDSAVYGMSQSSGKPMITMKWKIEGGAYDGKTMVQFLSFSQAALPGTKTNINRLSPELTAVPWKPAELCAQGYFNGKKAKLRVDLGEYNGEIRSQIKGIEAVSGEGDAFTS